MESKNYDEEAKLGAVDVTGESKPKTIPTETEDIKNDPFTEFFRDKVEPKLRNDNHKLREKRK